MNSKNQNPTKYEVVITCHDGDKFISRDIIKGDNLVHIASQFGITLLMLRDKELANVMRLSYDDDIPF